VNQPRVAADGAVQLPGDVRFPAALPYLFSALKVSATASIVGAIIGEAPSSIQNGLGGFIVNFNQYYSLNPENLWATNLIAALLGIAFFLVIVIAEAIVVRRAPEPPDGLEPVGVAADPGSVEPDLGGQPGGCARADAGQSGQHGVVVLVDTLRRVRQHAVVEAGPVAALQQVAKG